jgi:hypothetical protein
MWRSRSKSRAKKAEQQGEQHQGNAQDKREKGGKGEEEEESGRLTHSGSGLGGGGNTTNARRSRMSSMLKGATNMAARATSRGRSPANREKGSDSMGEGRKTGAEAGGGYYRETEQNGKGKTPLSGGADGTTASIADGGGDDFLADTSALGSVNEKKKNRADATGRGTEEVKSEGSGGASVTKTNDTEEGDKPAAAVAAANALPIAQLDDNRKLDFAAAEGFAGAKSGGRFIIFNRVSLKSVMLPPQHSDSMKAGNEKITGASRTLVYEIRLQTSGDDSSASLGASAVKDDRGDPLVLRSPGIVVPVAAATSDEDLKVIWPVDYHGIIAVDIAALVMAAASKKNDARAVAAATAVTNTSVTSEEKAEIAFARSLRVEVVVLERTVASDKADRRSSRFGERGSQLMAALSRKAPSSKRAGTKAQTIDDVALSASAPSYYYTELGSCKKSLSDIANPQPTGKSESFRNKKVKANGDGIRIG